MIVSAAVESLLDAQWTALETEWRNLLAREHEVVAAQIEHWEAKIHELRAAQDELLRTSQWIGGPDDMLSILGRSRREAYHSALLRWLLDPQARHGLGPALLEGLIRHCAPESSFSDLHRARCELEVHRGDTRADIVVFAPQVTLVIENKVDAGEQPRQCDRLYERFGRDPGALFLFLSPSGRAPETASGSAKEAFISMRYADIIRLLEHVLAYHPPNGANSRGREVVLNYLATLKQEFL